MQVLFAVLDDLFQFTLTALFGVVRTNQSSIEQDTALVPLQSQLPLPSGAPSRFVATDTDEARGGFFTCVTSAAIHTDPVVAYDNVLRTVPYGTTITVVKYGGRWAMVQVGDYSGWMLKDDMKRAATDVLPVLVNGRAYEATHPETVKLRRYIHDAFYCEAPALPLNASEYIMYRLSRSRRLIQWPETRPRLPGVWQIILRGNPSVHIGVVPKTGTVMEFTHEDAGHLLYVEAVFPDSSIQVSGVDYEGLGMYSELVIEKADWLELHPVFIEVL